MELLTTLNANPKIKKSQSKNYLVKILHLASHKNSGFNVCPNSSKGCQKGCLYTSGYGRYDRIQQARIQRTKLWFSNRAEFKEQLVREIGNFAKYCQKRNKKCAVRLNGTSDIPWEKDFPLIFSLFPTVQFYDYTKSLKRMFITLPKNYHLTFSRSESNDDNCLQVLRKRKNVAVVFLTENLPAKWKRFQVINGIGDDKRFLDQSGKVVGLCAKGRAKHDISGFVVDNY